MEICQLNMQSARESRIAPSSNGRISDSDSDGAGSTPAGAARYVEGSLNGKASDCGSE